MTENEKKMEMGFSSAKWSLKISALEVHTSENRTVCVVKTE